MLSGATGEAATGEAPAEAGAFSLTEERYDQSTYVGRASKFFNVVDPRTLLPGPLLDMPLIQARRLLADFKTESQTEQPNSLNHNQIQRLWLARKVVEAQVHPETNQVIPAPFRMSGFVPFGTPIIVGMLMAGTNPWANVFWQWLNQSHNAAINFANRNTSAEVSNTDLAFSYGVAVGTAVGIKLSADRVVQRLQMPALGRFVPFLAVASANVVNVGLMRKGELSQGIQVVSSDGHVLGVSQAAARKAIAETALTRVLLPIPILVFSPLMLLGVERMLPIVRKSRGLGIAVQASLVVLNFMVGLPLSMSLFKQRGEITLSELEPALQKRATVGGQTTDLFFYNKGL